MSDSAAIDSAVGRATTPGGMLREARQAQGVHIAALAASIKVVPRKLELLEADQFDQLPDPTFTRALAQAVCRALKIDPAPILALMPPTKGHRLEKVASGLNTPFHERRDGLLSAEWATVTGPVLWIAGLLLLAAVAVYLVPSEWLPRGLGGATPIAAPSVPAAIASVAPEPVSASAPPIDVAGTQAAGVAADVATPASPAASSSDVTPAAAVAEAAPVAAAAPAAPAAPVLQVRTTAASWVQVVAAGGQVLLSRVVQPGENVALDGAMPMKLIIGNATSTEVIVHGQPIDLATHTRDNVARLEVQ
jgi:cytoskeleton protein RodZ